MSVVADGIHSDPAHYFPTLPVYFPHVEDDGTVLSCPGSLKNGDIRTHTFHGFPGTVINTSLSPPSLHRSILHSQTRGIYQDVGHGQGSFSWTVAEICAKDGFWPDTISSDLHRGNIHGPAYDLPTVMSKFLAVGMPLYDVISSVTINPAQAIKKEGSVGSLSPGRCADVTVLRLSDCDVMLKDSQQQMRRVTQRLVPVAVWRAGERVAVKEQSHWPNKDAKYLAHLREEWEHLLVKDEQT